MVKYVDCAGVREMVYISKNDIHPAIAEAINQYYNQPVAVGVDIETTGLDPRCDRICTIQVSLRYVGTNVIQLDPGAFPKNLINYLTDSNVHKIFHYAMFDVGFLLYTYKHMLRSVKCTRTAASIVDPTRQKFFYNGKPSLSLAALVDHYFQDTLDKKLAVSDWSNQDLTEEQLAYAVKDSYYLTDLYYRLTEEMNDFEYDMYLAACEWLPYKVYALQNFQPDHFSRD